MARVEGHETGATEGVGEGCCHSDFQLHCHLQSHHWIAAAAPEARCHLIGKINLYLEADPQDLSHLSDAFIFPI